MKSFINIFLISTLICGASSAYAQDSYDAQNFATSDLNGTARFVGMGGALGALGGDISVMSTNPAGTAIYRKSDAALSFSGLFTDKSAMDHGRARMSFDQAGVVIAFEMDEPSSKGLQFVNFGVNYQKHRNFFSNQKTDIQNLSVFDQNGNPFNLSQSFQIANLCNEAAYNNYWKGSLVDMAASSSQHGGILNEFDETLVDGNGNPILDGQGNQQIYRVYEGVSARNAYFEKNNRGGSMQADVNLSFNISDQFFLGASLGVYDLTYSRESFYSETGVDGNSYNIDSWYKTEGDGFDIKLGFICRPIEDSPFRFGINVHTPIWYRLTDLNGATLTYKGQSTGYMASSYNAEYDYRYRTPWKFGFSLGHTIGKSFAIGAEYEVEDPSSCHYSSVDGGDLTYFRNTNRIIEETLRAQHTLKVGAEIKPIEEFSIRLGYNYISSPFKEGAFRTIGYDGIYTETDYTNWGAINRFTCGLGYRYKGGYIDLAYQYQAQKGDFFAFDDENIKATKINNNRSQLMATLGFRF